jgi:TolB-like protein
MVGKTISHYRILSTLGKGAMGVIYRAEDTRLGRTVALKFVSEALVTNRVAVERFKREARAVSALNHPNICTLHDVDEWEGQPFLVMECLEGGTLKERITGKQLTLEELFELSIQIVEALDAAHAKGIVHRDIKPSNLFVTTHGQVKIMDFGLAKLATEPKARGAPAGFSQERTATMSDSPLTSPGAAMGTAAYMSPEQARGEDLDARTDLFSFGVVLYEMATGCRPFQGSTAALVFDSILRSMPPSPFRWRLDLPLELERIINKALEKDRDMRYQTASDMRGDLKRLRRDVDSGRAVTAAGHLPAPSLHSVREGTASSKYTVAPPAPTASSAEYRDSGIKRHWRAVGLILAAIGMVAGAALYLIFRERPLGSLAALPFENVGGDPGTEYLSDGITESIINNLSQLPKLSVRSFSSVVHYKNKDINPLVAGRELNVRAVLTGRLVHHGNEFAINAELVDVRNNRQIWGSQYNRRAADILAIQEQISQEISEKLRLQLTREEKQRMIRSTTENTEAYQLYLQGRFQWNKRTLEGMQQSIEYFGRAIQKDSRYALAYAGQADSYALLADFNVLPAREVLPKLLSTAAKALELDDTLAEAHTSLAWARFHNWDWAGAEQEFKRAIELNPSYPIAHSCYGEYLTRRSRNQTGLAMISEWALNS